jgi:prepilin-type N-terminal cleavage/methylation domain-containing protein
MSMQVPKRRRGFSLIELLIVISIILIIAAIAVPKMNRQLMLAREQAAIRQINTIHQAETQFYSQYGRYAQTLAELGPPASGAPGPACLMEKTAVISSPSRVRPRDIRSTLIPRHSEAPAAAHFSRIRHWWSART